MAEAARKLDLIDTAPRFNAADVSVLNARFDGVATVELLETVLRQKLLGRLAIVSSFGAESAVLLHLVASIDPAVPVLFLETGKHFPETLEYRDALIDALRLSDVRNLMPDPAELVTKDATGLRWSYDPDGCCDLRKVRPLARALGEFDATLTGRKGFQSAERFGLPRFELDKSDTAGRIKVNPLIDWSADQIAQYSAAAGLPAHPLVEQGYLSVGCSPCTSTVAAGEDARSGRWRGWDKTECGIHVPGDDDALPPGYEPAF